MPSPYQALVAAHAARRDPAGWRGAGPVVLLVGPVSATELVLAAGMHPVELSADPDAATPTLDELAGPVALGWRGRSLLDQVLAARDAAAAVLFTGTTSADAGLYATVRELARTTGVALPPCHHLDAPGLARDTSRRYRRERLTGAMAWLGGVGGSEVTPGRLREAAAVVASRDAVLAELRAEQASVRPRLGGHAVQVAGQAGAALGPAAHEQLLAALVAEGFASAPAPVGNGPRIVLSGSVQDEPWLTAVLEESGAVVLDASGGGVARALERTPDVVGALAERPVRWSGRPAADDGELVADLVRRAREADATTLVHAAWDGDEVAAWDGARLQAGAPADLRVVVVRGSAGRHRAAGFSADRAGSGPRPRPVATATDRPARPGPPGARSRKVLTVSDSFSAHQREWFAETTQRAREGEPFAVVSADYPHELLRAMDVPYVVTQWWASIVGAKRLTAGHAEVLAAAGYAADVEPYSAQGLASHLASHLATGEEPWGGLPRPDLLGASLGTPPTQRLYTAWARETGARYLPLERSAETRWELSPTWWEDLRHDWDTALEPARLDLLQAELAGVVRGVQEQTGRRLDPDRLAEVLQLANEQAQANREARDLLAAARPAPAGVVDTMPATMVPQWHRGSVWARDAARALRDELAERVAAGQGVVADERLRLMWVGRGMWGDTGLYQHLEDTHGAVFVWSMYLALAADGYERQCAPGQDPVRALASRFAVMGDELRMPGWAGPWHVEEARRHGVDAAVAIADADPFVVRSLEAAGVPVLRLDLDNTAHDGGALARRRLEDFVAGLHPVR